MTAPSLHVVLRLEGEPELHVVAATEGDEQRLYRWFESGPPLLRVAQVVLELLEPLVAAREERER